MVAAPRAVPAIRAVHSTNGRWDLVAELDAPDLGAFSAALDAVRAVPGVVATESSLLLTTMRF